MEFHFFLQLCDCIKEAEKWPCQHLSPTGEYGFGDSKMPLVEVKKDLQAVFGLQRGKTGTFCILSYFTRRGN
jgi:hypothetical protein